MPDFIVNLVNCQYSYPYLSDLLCKINVIVDFRLHTLRLHHCKQEHLPEMIIRRHFICAGLSYLSHHTITRRK
jgi:hypothetical protein